MSNRTLALVSVVVIVLAVIVGFLLFTRDRPPHPQLYPSKVACEQATGRTCAFASCDYNCPGGGGFKGWIPTVRLKRTIIGLELKIDAPFSSAVLTVQENGSVLYFAQEKNKGEARDSRQFSTDQMDQLNDLIDAVGFFELQDQLAQPDDLQDGSTYTMTVSTVPAAAPRDRVDAASHTVQCYQFRCQQGFRELKNAILKFWGKSMMEVGV